MPASAQALRGRCATGVEGACRHAGVLVRMREDVAAYLARDPSARSAREVALLSPGLHAVWAHRAQHALWVRGHRMLALALARRTRRRTGVEIHPAATVGRRLVIDHGMGVVVGETAVIGDDCLVYHGVTLGMAAGKRAVGKGGPCGPRDRTRRHPRLGDGVVVGTGAAILGPVSVGAGARVGAGAVVLGDVPAGATAVGVPARVIRPDRSCPPTCAIPNPDGPPA